jgi:hypothetical protein
MIPPPPGTGSPPPALQNVLAAAVAELVRQVVRGEVAAFAPPAEPAPASLWMTPPKAAKITGLGVKMIRRLVRDAVERMEKDPAEAGRAGRFRVRLRNANPNPKQRKYLVHIDDVNAHADRSPSRVVPATSLADIPDRARRILAELTAKKGK